MQTWEIWYPEAAANGLLVARGRLDATDILWIHAAPAILSVTVRDAEDRPIAQGEGLIREGNQLPMTRLWREEGAIRREDRWPTEDDLGNLVILPGGEVGTLTAWWNADDASAWRWSVEFYNHR